MNLSQYPLLLSKRHLLEVGLSNFQFYQLLKDPSLTVKVGKKTFISKEKLLDKLGGTKNEN